MPQQSTTELSLDDQESEDLPAHKLRYLSCFVFIIIFSGGMLTNFFDSAFWWIIPVAAFSPFLTHTITLRASDNYRALYKKSLNLIDILMCGAAFAVIQFNPIMSALLLLVVSASVMSTSGFRIWLLSIGGLICEFGAAYIFAKEFIILGFPPAELIALTCFIAITFVTTLSYYSYKRARSLLSIQHELTNRQKDSAALSRKLSKYLPPQVWNAIFSGRADAKLETRRKKLTVFFSDIKGFSEISEMLQPEALTDLLNSYFTEMSLIATKYGGTIDKFVGDAILIFFGDPTSQGQKKDALACVLMAIEMRNKMKLMSQKWNGEGIDKPLQIRMGINTGYCTVGNFGAESRMDYTIIGKEVNLASRLEGVTLPNEILISEHTYNLIRDTIMCRDKGEIEVKGFTKPIPIYEVVDQRSKLGARQSFIECEFDGFSMYVDINKIKNYDKDRVILALDKASKNIKDKLIV